MTVPYRLEGLELAAGAPLGQEPGLPALEPLERPMAPREALEQVVLECLQRPPCVVGFSGGRDSSGVLALAMHVARAHGLQLPVAATNLFPYDVGSGESEWQELVVSHLGAPDWERVTFSDEMDLIGPVAQPLLLRFGACFPFNGHFGMRTFPLAANGSYLTGIGGDEVFQLSERNRLGAVLMARRKPSRKELATALTALAPAPLRARYYQGQTPQLPWLRSQASAELSRRMGTAEARQPIWNSPDLLDYFWRSKLRVALSATLGAFAQLSGTSLVHPLEHPLFLQAVATSRPRVGWMSRTDAMRELFGDLLPDQLLVRKTKAQFNGSFFNAHSREFVATWSGDGLDPEVVDADRLRETWRSSQADARSFSLLQAAWTAARSTDQLGGAYLST